MIFMVVDDSLAPYALADIRQIQAAGSSRDVDIVVQLNWKDAPVERYHVLSTKLEAAAVCRMPENATRAELLSAFLRQTQNDFPADHYMLELWGHAYGVGFGRSDVDRMPLAEIVRVLSEFAVSREGLKLDLLAGVTCRMSKLETAYELREVARFMVASQVGVPFLGWPSKAFHEDLIEAPSLTPEQLGKAIVSRFCESFRRRTVTMTMLDLDAEEPVLTAPQAPAKTVYTEIQRSEEDPDVLHRAFAYAAEDDVEPLVDLYDLCARLSAQTRSSEIRAAAQHVMDTLCGLGFVASHDAVGPLAERLHGVGIYVPQVALDTSSPTFGRLGFDQSRMWRKVLDRIVREAAENESQAYRQSPAATKPAQ